MAALPTVCVLDGRHRHQRLQVALRVVPLADWVVHDES